MNNNELYPIFDNGGEQNESYNKGNYYGLKIFDLEEHKSYTIDEFDRLPKDKQNELLIKLYKSTYDEVK